MNVDTGETIVCNFPEGMYPQEPIFVASPESSSEDDGILLVQGIDGEQEKGTFLFDCLSPYITHLLAVVWGILTKCLHDEFQTKLVNNEGF